MIKDATDKLMYLENVTIPRLQDKIKNLQIGEEILKDLLFECYCLIHEVVSEGRSYVNAPDPENMLMTMCNVFGAEELESVREARVKSENRVVRAKNNSGTTWSGCRSDVPDGFTIM